MKNKIKVIILSTLMTLSVSALADTTTKRLNELHFKTMDTNITLESGKPLGYVPPTYDQEGFDQEGYHKDTDTLFNLDGRDKDGWDENGYGEYFCDYRAATAVIVLAGYWVRFYHPEISSGYAQVGSQVGSYLDSANNVHYLRGDWAAKPDSSTHYYICKADIKQ